MHLRDAIVIEIHLTRPPDPINIGLFCDLIPHPLPRRPSRPPAAASSSGSARCTSASETPIVAWVTHCGSRVVVVDGLRLFHRFVVKTIIENYAATVEFDQWDSVSR